LGHLWGIGNQKVRFCGHIVSIWQYSGMPRRGNFQAVVPVLEGWDCCWLLISRSCGWDQLPVPNMVCFFEVPRQCPILGRKRKNGYKPKHVTI
jgi:hypothetical protein